ncbi:hypothetical protein ATO6_24325 [Oceanicola sp. 22II-s10i]|nr:hypothetical protein ATO6_24325 [Oceanicola sp. 22II-s10i]
MPGVDYAGYELAAIEDCLMLTGAFSRVQVYPNGDAMVIDVEEVDTRPGRIEAALSYVSQDGLVGELSAEKYNLFPGTYGAIRLSFNTDVRMLELNFYKADALGETLDLGLDIVGRDADFGDRSYAERGLRAEPYLAWTPSGGLRLEAGLGWRDYRMTDIAAGASPLLFREATDGISAPYGRVSLVYERSAEEGSDGSRGVLPGYAIRLDQYLWNLGTSEPLSDTRFEIRTRLPLARNYRLLTTLRAGSVSGLNGNATRAIDRHYLGADTFRGFAPRGIGPRDAGDALGGNHYFTGSVEIQRDFGTVLSVPMRAGVFIDAGSNWGLDDTLGGAIDDGWHSRSSVGLSVTIEVANTPVSLYVATPLRQRPGDETQAFGLSFSARF